MTDKPQTLLVKLKLANAGLEMELPLEPDGTLHQSLEPFSAVDGLSDLWQTIRCKLIDGAPIEPEESQAMLTLMDLMEYDPEGPKLLAVIRERYRRRAKQFMKRWDDQSEVAEAEKANADLDPYDSEARTLRRKKERLKKPV